MVNSVQVISINREIEALHERNRLAALNANTEAMDEIFSDNWSGVSPLGCVASKKVLIARFASGDLATDIIDVEERSTKVYGDSAVSLGLYRVKTVISGKPIDYRIRRTDMLVKTDGRWRIVASSVVRVADNASLPQPS